MGYYVNVNNVNIYVEDLNPECKKAILFLHGWPGNHNLFEYQFNKLPKLGYRCIGIDIRDFGKSDKPFYGYDYNTLSDDVRGVVEALGLQAAGWATAAIAKTWIKEVLFADMEAIYVPTLIIHGIHDEVVPFQLGEVQHRMIRNSRLVPLEFSGHGSFYDQRDEFNGLLVKFIES